MPRDLPLQLGRFGPVDPLVWQSKRRGINVEEHAGAHGADYPEKVRQPQPQKLR
jgi:hypothetical protein